MDESVKVTLDIPKWLYDSYVKHVESQNARCPDYPKTVEEDLISALIFADGEVLH